MSLNRAFVTGVALGVLLFIFDLVIDTQLFSYLFEGNLWQSVSGGYLLKGFLFSLVIGIFFVCFYAILYDCVPGKKKSTQKAFFYGIIFWAIAVLPSALLFELQTTVPNLVIIFWLIKGLVKWPLAGYVVHALMQR